MIALGGPKLKLRLRLRVTWLSIVSMIALGGPKLKLTEKAKAASVSKTFQ